MPRLELLLQLGGHLSHQTRAGLVGLVCTLFYFFRRRWSKSILANVDADLDHFCYYRSPDDEEQGEKVVGFLHFRESSSGSLSIAS